MDATITTALVSALAALLVLARVIEALVRRRNGHKPPQGDGKLVAAMETFTARQESNWQDFRSLFARKMDTLTDKIDSMNDRQKDRHQATIDCLRGIKADMASHKGLLESIKATQPIPRG